MRILHVVFSALVSGSSRYICDLGAKQIAAGHAVGVALAPRPGQGVSIYDSLAAGAAVLSVLGSPGWIGLARAIAAFKPDILHFHDGRGPRALRWLPAHPPSVITLHLGYKKVMAGVDGVIRIANWQDVDGYRGYVTTVRNWRTAKAPVAPEEARALRVSIGASDAALIGCAVRLHPVKNVGLLISAFRALPEAKAVLAILSDGPERPLLEAQAAGDSRIKFLGMRSDIDAWFAAFDYFVQPSSSEHSPLTLLEAMDAGLPIAAAANAGSAEMLEGQPAQLFPVGDVRTLGAILRAWLDAPPQRIAYDLSAFDPDRAAAAIGDAYSRAIAAHASGAGRRQA